MRSPHSVVLSVRALSVLFLGSLSLAACGNDSKATTTLASITPLIPSSITSVTSIAPGGTGNLGTIPQLPSVPTTAPAPGATTTSTRTTAGPPCTLAAIHAANGPAPAGITDIDLRCEGDWASWVGRANDPTTSDGYFAVAQRTNSGWKTVNLGTAGVCADGGVPEALWTALNCTE